MHASWIFHVLKKIWPANFHAACKKFTKSRLSISTTFFELFPNFFMIKTLGSLWRQLKLASPRVYLKQIRSVIPTVLRCVNWRISLSRFVIELVWSDHSWTTACKKRVFSFKVWIFFLKRSAKCTLVKNAAFSWDRRFTHRFTMVTTNNFSIVLLLTFKNTQKPNGRCLVKFVVYLKTQWNWRFSKKNFLNVQRNEKVKYRAKKLLRLVQFEAPVSFKNSRACEQRMEEKLHVFQWLSTMVGTAWSFYKFL